VGDELAAASYNFAHDMLAGDPYDIESLRFDPRPAGTSARTRVGAADAGGGVTMTSHAESHHDPHLAHHFETPPAVPSARLGMWVFLVTEILFFGGLFCAYAVYRANHPEIFIFGHHFLDKGLGAFNTWS